MQQKTILSNMNLFLLISFIAMVSSIFRWECCIVLNRYYNQNKIMSSVSSKSAQIKYRLPPGSSEIINFSLINAMFFTVIAQEQPIN